METSAAVFAAVLSCAATFPGFACAETETITAALPTRGESQDNVPIPAAPITPEMRQRSPKSLQSASVLCTAGALGAGILMMGAENDNTVLAGLLTFAVGGLAVAPSTGYFASGQSGHGFKTSGLRAAASLAGLVVLVVNDPWEDPHAGQWVAFGALEAFVVGSAVRDIVRLPSRVREADQRRMQTRIEPQLRLTAAGPVVGGTVHF